MNFPIDKIIADYNKLSSFPIGGETAMRSVLANAFEDWDFQHPTLIASLKFIDSQLTEYLGSMVDEKTVPLRRAARVAREALADTESRKQPSTLAFDDFSEDRNRVDSMTEHEILSRLIACVRELLRKS